MKKLSLAFFVIIFLSLTPISLVLAQESNGKNKEEIKAEIEAKRHEIQERIKERKKDLRDRLASKSAARKIKLSEKKQAICEKRKNNLVKRSNNIITRVERHFNRFGVIVEKVDNFYSDKLIPKGVVISNYETLKADIEIQKAEVQAALTSAKDKIANFDCTSENPKEHLEDFKIEAKNVHEAMKDYRSTIKNFIKAIKADVKEKKSATTSAEAEFE